MSGDARQDRERALLTSADGRLMTQQAPYPVILEDLVDRLVYRDGWTFELIDAGRGQGSIGLSLVITITAKNSYPPYAPLHGPGNDPYLITVESTGLERRTSFRGTINPQ